MAIKVPDWKGEFAYVGKSKAIVIDNKDPLKKGRIRVQSPAFGITGFIHFLTSDDGKYSPPDIGTIVYVEAAGADKRFPIATAVVNDGSDTNPDTPSIFRRDVPTNRGWVSPGILDSIGKPTLENNGHSIEIDDGVAILSDGTVTHTAENRGIRFTTFGGHSIEMFEENADGQSRNNIIIKTKTGLAIELKDSNDSAEPNRIRIKNSSGTIFLDLDMENDIIEIDANNVKLGTNAAQAIVRGDAFRTLFNSHRHISGSPGVPTGTPIQQMDPSSSGTHLSDKHRVE